MVLEYSLILKAALGIFAFVFGIVLSFKFNRISFLSILPNSGRLEFSRNRGTSIKNFLWSIFFTIVISSSLMYNAFFGSSGNNLLAFPSNGSNTSRYEETRCRKINKRDTRGTDIAYEKTTKSDEALYNIFDKEYLDIGNSELKEIYTIDRCPNVQYLQITNAVLSDLQFLEKFENLKILKIIKSSINTLNGILLCKNLINIGIEGSNINDYTEMECLTKIRHFNAKNSNFKDVSTILRSASSLNSLSIANTQIADFSVLLPFKNLESLDISQTRVSSLKGIDKLQKLTSVFLYKCPITDITPLKALKELRILFMPLTKIVDISSLQYLTNLTYLDISYNNINNYSALDNLKNLKYLNMENTGSDEEIKNRYYSLFNFSFDNT